jgi:hypothetical protein
MKNDRSEGAWNYYTDEGELAFTLEYQDGIPTDRELYRKMMEENLMNTDSTQAPQQPSQPF